MKYFILFLFFIGGVVLANPNPPVDPLPPLDPIPLPEQVNSQYESCNQHLPGSEAESDCKEAVDRQICMNTCVGDSDFCNCKCDGGVVLNTNVPFVGRCIAVKSADGSQDTEQLNAFPRLMKGLSRLLLSLILLLSFIMVIAGGVMIASSGANSSGYSQGKKLITKVALGILLLGLMGVILRLINPNFFT